MLHILYLVHDVSDPAVRRRLKMLRAGGATVNLAGFRREEQAIGDIDGVKPIDLGRTWDGRFHQRLAAVAKASLSIRAVLAGIPRPDVIIARNLEMLWLARRVGAVMGSADVPVVYECLDIHRLVLRQDAVGYAMRGAERFLGRGVSLLMTSSPAFVANYFGPYGQIGAPVEIVENRHLELLPDEEPSTAQPSPPWRIGWFGALRCRRSLELLAAFTRRQKGRYEVILRGRPALSEFEDFHGFVAAEPHLSFEGPYRNPEDVGRIYGDVHFSWVIDFFEEGLNSSWLLPNRLYEGCRFGAVPITVAGTETARFAAQRGVGVRLQSATPEAVADALVPIDAAGYARLKESVLSGRSDAWSYGPADCRALVSRLGRLTPVGQPRSDRLGRAGLTGGAL